MSARATRSHHRHTAVGAYEGWHRPALGVALVVAVAAALVVGVVALPRETAALPDIARHAMRIALPRWGKLVRVNVGSREGFEAMNRAIAANGIRPVIDKVFPFERAVDAYEYEATGQHFGKVVITI